MAATAASANLPAEANPRTSARGRSGALRARKNARAAGGSRVLDRLITQLLAQRPPRANSLIVTVYGDMIAPHGGTVWLGSFINLVQPLGLNARMVRTSVFRLSREKWLVSEQIGRRSYYSLTATGRRRFEHAYRRIYEDPRTAWRGEWQLVLMPPNALAPALREALRKELQWEGFAAIAPGVLAHPSAHGDSLLDILQGTGTHDKVVVLQAQTLGALAQRPLKELAEQCWNLAQVAAGYENFIARFRGIARALRATSPLDPQQCFVIRALLMHEFRRVQLRDPQLPRQLLTADWPGDPARDLCRELYRLCQQKAEEHLLNVLETADGALPPAAASFYARFGGLLGHESAPGQSPSAVLPGSELR
ncbi:MAG TPA: phenylacetic acid degradation operon negative regulatory protein PaaX [Burkholderiaceae bacterium]|nr:phenylacetic acid degradation operon negative regulatory protein PaaX [Burkholderiaceae bacterium]